MADNRADSRIALGAAPPPSIESVQIPKARARDVGSSKAMDGRSKKATMRTAQLNLGVTEDEARRFRAMADERGMKLGTFFAYMLGLAEAEKKKKKE